MATVPRTTTASLLPHYLLTDSDEFNQDIVGVSIPRMKMRIMQAISLDEDLDAKDNEGYTLLMKSVKRGDVDSVILLRKSDADFSATCTKKGYTALMMAVNSMFDDELDARMVDALLEGDVDTSCVNYADPASGFSALMIALDAGKYVASRKLIDAGADVNQLNASGYSALTYAVMVGDVSTIDFLLEQNSRLAINQMWDAVGLALERKNISLFLKLWINIQDFPQKFIDIGVESVMPEAMHKILEIVSPTSPGQGANMAMLVANNPGPNSESSISSASMASRESVQGGRVGVAPSAANVRKQRPTVAHDDDVAQAVRPHNPTTTTQQGQSGFKKTQLPAP